MVMYATDRYLFEAPVGHLPAGHAASYAALAYAGERLYETPAVTPAPPPLISTETAPPSTTLYLRMSHGGEAPARPMTGIFIPDNYRMGPQVDLILYLHGHHRAAPWPPTLTINQYWNAARYSYFAFREGLNTSGKNAILVAPTLGPRSQAGRLARAGGLGDYLDAVMAALAAYGPFGQAPTPGTIVLACHSGGGAPMRAIATTTQRYGPQIKECWGFDCLYNTGDETVWARWAQSRPDANLYIHYGSGGTAARSEALRKRGVQLGVSNVFVEGSTKLGHNLVPITHWQTRLSAAPFADK